MSGQITLGILSDIHYAGAAERARGRDYEYREIANPALRLLARLYRHFIWLRDPLYQGHLLDRFLEQEASFDYLIANGDYSCNSAFVGLSDDAACASARECLGKLRRKFGARLLANYGDHELGKMSMFGGRGGMRLTSLRRGREDLALKPFWKVLIGNYVLMGVASSLVALPVFESDILPSESPEWGRVRAEHLEEVRKCFAALAPDQRVLLFCHDPTALPFLSREPEVEARLSQIEQTIIGHLHSNLVLWKSRLLAGMPAIGCLGHTVRRLSTALNQAREWRPFKVRLCPALAGIELSKRGGYLTAQLDTAALQPARFKFHRIVR